MADHVLTFQFVVEAGLQELVEACDHSEMAKEDPSLGIEAFYGRVIIHFLRGENEELAEKIQALGTQFADHPENEFLSTACQLRELIRQRQQNPALVEKALELSLRISRWRGELLILLATASTLSDDYRNALRLYAESAEAFAGLGCHRKALRARMNVLVCESHLFPNRNLFARYHDLYRQAVKKPHREIIVATTCLLNISREYQKAGAPLAALKYCNRALALFEMQMGEINYFLTLAHRAHLLCDLGRKEEARIDFEAAQLGRFKEVEAALEVVAAMLSGTAGPKVTDGDSLLPTWKERVRTGAESDSDKPVRLSSLEEKLIKFLAAGPRERVDILDNIYGPLLSYETKLNRFKSLLATLRKKFPNLVISEEGRYRLADEILVPHLSNPKTPVS